MKSLIKDKRAFTQILGIIVIGITVALGSVVGLTIIANAKSVYDRMQLSRPANNAMGNTTNTIYNVWPMQSLIVLAAFGAAALGVFIAYLGLKS